MSVTLNNFFHKDFMASNPDECDYSRIDSYVKFAEAISRNIYQPIYIVDCCRQNILFASGNFKLLCGMTPDEFKENGNKMYFEAIPEDEQAILIEVVQQALKLLYSLPEEIREKLVLSYFFSMVNNSRRRLIHHKITPLAFSNDGKIWLALCTISMSSNKKLGNITLRKYGDSDYFFYSLNKHIWYHKEGIELTEMEHDILLLSSQGYTIKEIAYMLCKSEDSIKSYKRVLFAKLGVKSITEAVFAAINYYLLD